MDKLKFNQSKAKSLNRSYQTDDIVRQRNATLAKLGLKEGDAFLDVGCGSGLLCRQAAKDSDNQVSVLGIDISESMLELGKVNCRDFPSVSFQQLNAENLATLNSRFDAIACTQTLLYCEKPAQVVEDMYQRLNPGGRLAIIETEWKAAILNSDYPLMTRKILNAWDESVPSPELVLVMKKLMKKAGFSNVDVDAVPIVNTRFDENAFSFSMMKWLAKNAREREVISEQQAGDWLENLEDLSSCDEYFFCVNRYLFSAVK